MQSDLFSHLPISKRVRYRVAEGELARMKLLNLGFNAYEYDLFPLHRLLTRRHVRAWLPRWREGPLYARLAFGWLTTGRLDADA